MINKLCSHLLFIAAGIIWGASFTYQLEIVKTLGAINYTFYTSTFSTVMLLLIVMLKKDKILYRWRSGLLLGLSLAGLEIFQMMGLKLSGATSTAFLSNLGMILVPFVGALLFRHKLKKVHLVCLGASLVGLYYFTGASFNLGLGNYYLLISALFMALYFLFSEKFEDRVDTKPINLLFHSFFIISIISFYLVYQDYGSFDMIPIYDIATYKVLIFQAVLFTLIPYSLIQYASKVSRDMDITIFGGIIEPLSGAAFAYYILGERLVGTQLIGLYILILAFAMGVYGINKRG
jgi:drug/metabolite transporter (DMT)-like permease